MAQGTQDVSKLPKWAQQRIATLEQKLANAHAQLALGSEDSDTFIRASWDASSPVYKPLGKEPTVMFGCERIDGHAYMDDTFQVRFVAKTRTLKITASDGVSTVQIEPQSSNVVNLRSARFKSGVPPELA